MAIEGEKIDFNKKYKKENIMVDKFELSGRSDAYVVRAFFSDGTFLDYTYDGFCYCNKEKSVRDLVLCEDEKQLPKTKKIKVVQISGNKALCDDNTMFVLNAEWTEWTKLPDVPQD